jgi:hypothetical protein
MPALVLVGKLVVPPDSGGKVPYVVVMFQLPTLSLLNSAIKVSAHFALQLQKVSIGTFVVGNS